MTRIDSASNSSVQVRSEVAGLAKFNNPEAPAVSREAEEDWGRK